MSAGPSSLRRRFGFHRAALVCGALLLACATAVAAPAARDLPTQVSGWTVDLAHLEQTVESDTASDDRLSQARDALEQFLQDAQATQQEEAPILAAHREDLATLGPPPAAGQPPESPNITYRRNRLNAAIAEIEGRLKEIDLLIARAQRLQNRIAVERRARFEAHLLNQTPSPLSPFVWSRLWTEVTSTHASTQTALSRLFSTRNFEDQLGESAAIIASILVLAAMLMWPLRRWLLRRYGRDATIAAPTYLQLVRAMLVVTFARAVLPTLTAGVVYVFILNEGLLSEAGRAVAQSVFLAFLLFTWSLTLVLAALAPANPTWRILAVPTRFVRGFRTVSTALALVLSCDVVSSALIETFDVRLEITIMRDFVLTLAVVALLLSLLLRRALWIGDGAVSGPARWRWQRGLAAFALVATLGVAVAGYVSLGRFIALQIFFGGGLLLLLVMVRKVASDLMAAATSSQSWITSREQGEEEQTDWARGRFWLSLLLDIALIAFGALIEAFLWGADWQDIRAILVQAVTGVTIGELKLSIGDIATAAGILFLGVAATRGLQSAFAKQILPQTRLDQGLQNSIRIGIGYLGMTLAAVFAISALGLNLSNLALVAGALSVGIGFGLQSVVNNFVSGLVLLVERPIKIGDWISVGDVQGFVRRISVRATQVETFDKATVFIPNSELTSKSLTNLSHPDTTGRVVINIGVAYGSDLAAVRDLLLDIARKNQSILTYPAPLAVLSGFGDSAVNFQLIGYLANVANVYVVTSDLCLEIDAAFRKAGVEIPFPQRDLHIRSSPAKME